MPILLLGKDMKIIHSSDIGLGRSFPGLKSAGDRLRAEVKTTFSKIIDYTIEQKADLLIIAGNLFDTVDISKNLQDFVIRELARLKSTQAVILPGKKDPCTDGSFWRSWNSHQEYKHIHVFANPKNPVFNLNELNCRVYGLFSRADEKPGAFNLPPKPADDKILHVGVMCEPPESAGALLKKANFEFDYVALGGDFSFRDLTATGINAAYCGSPERLDFGQIEAGNFAVVEINSQKQLTIAKKQIGQINWRSEEIKARDILSNNDLIERLKMIADPNLLLRVTLTGLALFEAELSPLYAENTLKGDFLYLEIVDEMKVLPENVSEVKVSEKTLLGQYIKVMAKDIGEAAEVQKQRLEKSLKIGYALLQGREIW